MTCQNYGKFMILRPETKGCGNCTIDLNDSECLRKLSAKFIASTIFMLFANNDNSDTTHRIKDNKLSCDGNAVFEGMKCQNVKQALFHSRTRSTVIAMVWMDANKNRRDDEDIKLTTSICKDMSNTLDLIELMGIIQRFLNEADKY